MIKLIRNIKTKMRKVFKPRFTLVYRKKDGSHGIYEISKPRSQYTFGNQELNEEESGFRSWCYNRHNWRCFRHDGVISMVRE